MMQIDNSDLDVVAGIIAVFLKSMYKYIYIYIYIYIYSIFFYNNAVS